MRTLRLMKASTFWLYSVIAFLLADYYVFILMGQTAQTPQPKSGIELNTVLAPLQPAQKNSGSETGRPHPATVVISSAAGGNFEVKTDEAGHARIELPPGQYTVAGKGSAIQPPRRPNPQYTAVKNGEFTKVQLVYDSGIR